jgi:hypothetical protein
LAAAADSGGCMRWRKEGEREEKLAREMISLLLGYVFKEGMNDLVKLNFCAYDATNMTYCWSEFKFPGKYRHFPKYRHGVQLI